jgi:hypothetical protein
VSGCRVRVCRDCCCGSLSKHPGVDREGLLARLRSGVAGSARVDVTPCLLACDRSDVVVVSPSQAGRRAGARPVWLAHVLDDGIVDAISAWVRDGGPGLAEPPAAVRLHVTDPGPLAEQALA